MKSGRGGERPGAGRKPSENAEEWTTQRVKTRTLAALRVIADEVGVSVPELLDTYAEKGVKGAK